MTKELYYVTNEFAVELDYEDIDVSATVIVTSSSSEAWESDVRVDSIDSNDEDYEIEGALYGDIEEFILANWDKFEEIK